MTTELGRRLAEARSIIIEGHHRPGWASTCSICGKRDGEPKYWVRALVRFVNHPTQRYEGGGDIGGYICAKYLERLPREKISRDFRQEDGAIPLTTPVTCPIVDAAKPEPVGGPQAPGQLGGGN